MTTSRETILVDMENEIARAVRTAFRRLEALEGPDPGLAIVAYVDDDNQIYPFVFASDDDARAFHERAGEITEREDRLYFVGALSILEPGAVAASIDNLRLWMEEHRS